MHVLMSSRLFLWSSTWFSSEVLQIRSEGKPTGLVAARTTHTSSPSHIARRPSEALLRRHSQVNQQHGSDHHDEATEGGVEVDDAEQDAGAGHGIEPVQPIAVQLVIVKRGAALSVHLDAVGRLVLWQRVRIGLHTFVGRVWLTGGRGGGGGRGGAERL